MTSIFIKFLYFFLTINFSFFSQNVHASQPIISIFSSINESIPSILHYKNNKANQNKTNLQEIKCKVISLEISRVSLYVIIN